VLDNFREINVVTYHRTECNIRVDK